MPPLQIIACVAIMPPAATFQEATLASQKEVEDDVKIPPFKVSCEEERPFPWNIFSDRTYFMAGCIILLFISIPSMTIILLSNVLGFVLLWSLFDYNPLFRRILNFVRSAQRGFFVQGAHYILLDPRDASY